MEENKNIESDKKSLNSAIWYTISNIIAKGITILLTPVYARILSTNEYGVYTNFVSWQNILVIIFTLDLSSTVLRARFDYKKDKEFASYVFTIAIFSIVFPMICAGALLLLGNRTWEMLLSLDFKYIIILYVIIMFSSLLQIFQAEQRSQVKYKLSSLVTLLYGVTSFAVPLALLWFIEDKLDALLIGVMLNIVIWSVLFFIYFLLQKRDKIKFEYIKYALYIALPIVPHLLANILMGNSDKVMINSMCGPEYAALYGVVFTCATAISLLRNSLNSAWVPWFYKEVAEKNYVKVRKVSSIFIDLFSAGTIVVCLLGPEIVAIIGGSKYMEAVTLVPIIMLGCYYNFLYVFYVNIEFYEKKTINISKITIVTAVINIILNYFGIKLLGYQAAAYTTAICGLLTIFLHYLTTRSMNNAEICDNKLIFRRALEGILVVALSILLYNYNIIRWIILIILFIVACIVALVIFKKYKDKI